jgi:hypothetical protein
MGRLIFTENDKQFLTLWRPAMLKFERAFGQRLVCAGTPVLCLFGVLIWIISASLPAVAASQARLLTSQEMSAVFGDAAEAGMCQMTIPCPTTWKLDPTQNLCTQCYFNGTGDPPNRIVCCPYKDQTKSCDSASAGNSPCATCWYYTTQNSNSACPPVCDGLTNQNIPCSCADYKGGDGCLPPN